LDATVVFAASESIAFRCVVVAICGNRKPCCELPINSNTEKPEGLVGIAPPIVTCAFKFVAPFTMNRIATLIFRNIFFIVYFFIV
jgi:hypothetical protein